MTLIRWLSPQWSHEGYFIVIYIHFKFELTVSLLSRMDLKNWMKRTKKKKKTCRPAGLTLMTWTTGGVVFGFVSLHHQAAQKRHECGGWTARVNSDSYVKDTEWGEHEQTAATNILWLSLCLNVFQSESLWKSVQTTTGWLSFWTENHLSITKKMQTSACSVITCFFDLFARVRCFEWAHWLWDIIVTSDVHISE